VILASLLTVALAGAPGVFAQGASDAHMLNLSCVEALVSIGQAHLAGVFSFVPEKDAPAAFADLIVHDKKALKKYLGKLDGDFKQAAGLSNWDHEALIFALSIYASPMAQTLDKPSGSQMTRMTELGHAPTMTLEQLTARRRKG
jgi:hypothetical protein